jgi:hypothetical protein
MNKQLKKDLKEGYEMTKRMNKVVKTIKPFYRKGDEQKKLLQLIKSLEDII